MDNKENQANKNVTQHFLLSICLGNLFKSNNK